MKPFQTIDNESILRARGFQSLLGIILVGLCLIPAQHTRIWTTESFVMRLSVLILMVVVVWDKTYSRIDVLIKDGVGSIVILLCITTGISAVLSQDVFHSFEAWRGLIAIGIWGLVLRVGFQRWPQAFRVFEFFFQWVLGFNVILGFIQWCHTYHPPMGIFPNQNIFADFLGIGGIYLFVKAQTDSRVIIKILLGSTFIVWALTLSRGALIAMALVGLFYVLIHWKTLRLSISKWTTRRKFVMGTGALGVLIALFPMVYRLVNAYKMDPRAYFRIYIWRAAFRMFEARPWLGFGPGTFAAMYGYFRLPQLWLPTAQFAHNEYLQMLDECGLVTLFIFLILFFVLMRNFWTAVSAPRTIKKVSPSIQASEWAWMILLLVAFHNVVDFTIAFWPICWIVIVFLSYGMSFHAPPATNPWKISENISKSLMGLLSLVLIVVLGLGSVKNYVSQMEYLNGVHDQVDKDWVKAKHDYHTSLIFDKTNSMSWNGLATINNQILQSSISKKLKRYFWTQSLNDFNQAIKNDSISIPIRNNFISFLIQQNQLPWALSEQFQLDHAMPPYPPNDVTTAEILMLLRHYASAKRYLRASQRIDGYYLPAYFMEIVDDRLANHPRMSQKKMHQLESRVIKRKLGVSKRTLERKINWMFKLFRKKINRTVDEKI